MGLDRLGRDPVQLEDLVRLRHGRDLVHVWDTGLLLRGRSGWRVRDLPGQEPVGRGQPPCGRASPARRPSRRWRSAPGHTHAGAVRPIARARRRSGLDAQTRELVGPRAWSPSASSSAVSLFLGFGAGPVGGWLEDGIRLLVGRAVALAPLVLIAARRRPDPATARCWRPARCASACSRSPAAPADGAGRREPRPRRRAPRGRGSTRASSRSAAGCVGRDRVLGHEHTRSGAWARRSWSWLGLLAAMVLISGASLGHVVRRGGQGAAVGLARPWAAASARRR